jgi:hypothetical protein
MSEIGGARTHDQVWSSPGDPLRAARRTRSLPELVAMAGLPETTLRSGCSPPWPGRGIARLARERSSWNGDGYGDEDPDGEDLPDLDTAQAAAVQVARVF